MPNNYGPNTNPGQTRTRISQIQGNNVNVLEVPGSVPSLVYSEETVIRLAEAAPYGATERSLGGARYILVNYTPAADVAIRNPMDDVVGPVGRLPASLTQAECFAVLYSMGRQAQSDQDILDNPVVS